MLSELQKRVFQRKLSGMSYSQIIANEPALNCNRQASQYRFDHDDDRSQYPTGLVQGSPSERWSAIYAVSQFTEELGRREAGELQLTGSIQISIKLSWTILRKIIGPVPSAQNLVSINRN